MRRTVLLLLLCSVLCAKEENVDALRAKAQAELETAKPAWEKFVFDASTLSDDDLKRLIDGYDRCIDLCQKITEATEDGDGEADALVIQLARRTAKLRATLWGREMTRKAKAAADKPKPPEPDTRPAPEPEPAPEQPRGEAAPPEPEPEKEAPAVLPTIEESSERRAAGIQSARNFVMQYFASRKYKSTLWFCGKATCNACRSRVGHLNVYSAKNAYWLCYSPLYRANAERKAKWLEQYKAWRLDPRKVPDVLTKLTITKVEYHGLWADVEWEQWGVTNDAKKTFETVKRRLVRAGNRWFFYDEETDRTFFSE